MQNDAAVLASEDEASGAWTKLGLSNPPRQIIDDIVTAVCFITPRNCDSYLVATFSISFTGSDIHAPQPRFLYGTSQALEYCQEGFDAMDV